MTAVWMEFMLPSLGPVCRLGKEGEDDDEGKEEVEQTSSKQNDTNKVHRPSSQAEFHIQTSWQPAHSRIQAVPRRPSKLVSC